MPIFKKTKCTMKWCYSPSRHKDGTCDKICAYNTVYVQTNADKIRAMSDEELAEMLYNIDGNENWDGVPVTMIMGHAFLDEYEVLEWLNKEVDE